VLIIECEWPIVKWVRLYFVSYVYSVTYIVAVCRLELRCRITAGEAERACFNLGQASLGGNLAKSRCPTCGAPAPIIRPTASAEGGMTSQNALFPRK